MRVVLYITIDAYTAILKNCLSIACLAQWIEHVNIAVIFLSSVLLVQILYAHLLL